MIKAIRYENEPKPEFIPVDQWVPQPEDLIFQTNKRVLIVPISQYYGLQPDCNLDSFAIGTKRAYSGEAMREHLPHYLNYFEKYYDLDKEVYVQYCRFKYLIDYQSGYTKENFIHDIKVYLLNPGLLNKFFAMNEDNYVPMDTKKYVNEKNPSLVYNDDHAKVLMWVSLIFNMLIPLLTHFAYVHKIGDINKFLLEVFNIVLNIPKSFGIDIYNKLYETSYSTVNKQARSNSGVFNLQDIRSINNTTHSVSSLENLILNIIPKYNYTQKCVLFNYVSIRQNTYYQVVGIDFEYNYVPLDNSKRDEDNNSEFDKFESFLIKQNESLYLQNKVACEQTMRDIEVKYGPFDENEIAYYRSKLANSEGEIINSFQRNLIFNLFYKYFGDPYTIRSINSDDYIKLMIVARKQLLANNMVILPYIISSKIDKLQQRKSINRKESLRIQKDPLYAFIKEKYDDDKIENYILYIMATILSSDFSIIDYWDKSLDGHQIQTSQFPDVICHEILMYIALI